MPTLAELIAAAPDGTIDNPTVIDGNGETFVDEETVLIAGRHHLTVANLRLEANTDGTDAFAWTDKRNWPRNRSHFCVNGASSYITFDNVAVRGPNANGGTGQDAYVGRLEAQHAFQLDQDSDHITLRNCEASYIYGDCVYVRATNIAVDDFHGHHNGRQGFAFTDCADVLVRRLSLHDIRRAMFDLEPNSTTGSIRRVTVEDGVMSHGRLLGVASGGKGGDLGDIIFRRCSWEYTTGPVKFLTPEGTRRGPIMFEDCSFRVPGIDGAAFQFDHIDGLTFRRVTAVAANPQREPTGVRLFDCNQARIGQLDFTGFAVDVFVSKAAA